MKIALCLFGKTGSKGGKTTYNMQDDIDPKIAYFFYKNNLLNYHDVDVFIHSWSVNHKNKLLHLYKPKDMIFEKQRFFFPDKALFLEFIKVSTIKQKIVWLYNLFFAYKYGTPYKYRFKCAQATYSRFYSAKESLNLMNNFEKINKFTYDFVISSRLDLCIFKKINFKSLSRNYLYFPDNVRPSLTLYKEKNQLEIMDRPNQINDEIIISSSKNMSLFAKIYYELSSLTLTNHKAPYEFIIKNNLKYSRFLLFNYDYSLNRVIIYNEMENKLENLLIQ